MLEVQSHIGENIVRTIAMDSSDGISMQPYCLIQVFLLQIFIWCFNNFNKHNIYSIIIFISMIGFSMNWLKMDSLRIYAFWLCLAIIFAIDYKKTNNV